MSIEMSTDRAICFRCGTAFSKRRGYFPASYADMHKGVGFLPICRDCVDKLYNKYLAQCEDAQKAVRQVCRKLDLYWSDSVFDSISKKNSGRSLMSQYITRINTTTYAGKSYDDTLSDEGTLWTFNKRISESSIEKAKNQDKADEKDDEPSVTINDIPEDVRIFWGSGYTPEMYLELEQRRTYWMSRFPSNVELDIGTEALIRQICSLELDINRDRAAGRSVEKSVTALNTLLGSANLKPVQKKQDEESSLTDNTPFGVWIKRWEDQRPVPEPDPELQDVDGIVKYIEVWFKGHLSKMLDLKNSYSKMYQEEIDKIRVERPEYEDDSDEDLFYDVFGGGDDESE